MSYKTTKELLLRAPLPEETRTYKPVSHLELIDLSLESIHKAGFQIERELYASAREGNIATGKYLIKDAADSEMQLQIMWQNSYDKSLCLTFAIGANVLVCTNGLVAFRSANSFKRKHVGEIQIFTPNAIPSYIKEAGQMFSILQKDRDQMKQLPVNKRLIAQLLGRMYIEEQFLESTQLNIIKRELENPTHEYINPGSLWELYQFTTFAIGGIHPSRWMQDHMKAHKFFTTVMDEFDSYEEVEDRDIVVEDRRQLKLFNE